MITTWVQRLRRVAGPAALAGTVLSMGLAGPASGALAAPRSAVAPGTISTIAGGVGGPGLATTIASPACGVTFNGSHLYVADGATVRSIDISADALTTPVGDGINSRHREYGILSTGAAIDSCGTAVASNGNIVIADSPHVRIEVAAAVTGRFFGHAMTAGHFYLLAGDGQNGYSGSGVPALESALTYPPDVAFDHHGNLVLDVDGIFSGAKGGRGGRVDVIAARTGTFYGQAMKAGYLYSVAGDGKARFSGNGVPALQAGLGEGLGSVSVDPAGNLVIADIPHNRIRVVAEASGNFYGRAMTPGDIYTVAGDGKGGFAGDAGVATKAELDQPRGVTVDGAGNLVIADTGNNRVRVVASRTGTFYGQAMTKGHIYTVAGTGTAGFAGDGGPAASAELDEPSGVAVDAQTGNLAVSDSANAVVRLIAAATGSFYGQAMTAGDIYSVAGNGQLSYSGDGGPALQAEFSGLSGVTLAAGNVVVADTGNETVRLLAESTGTYFGQSMTAGDVYTVAGNGTYGSSGDGGPATQAELAFPQDVAVDSAGNLIIPDGLNNRVRVVAASAGTFYGQAMKTGYIYTVAGTGTSGFSGDGGPATSAKLDGPASVGVDSAGNLLIADEFNMRVRVVAATTGRFYGQAMTAGDIYTIAGDGGDGFSGDGGPALQAQISFPQGATVDGAGNVLVADTDNHRVRVVAASTGMFYGQAMTKGDIYTIAGGGDSLGDGGPATSAELTVPVNVTVDSSGNIIIPDPGASRLRVVAAVTGTFYGVAMTKGDIYTVAGDGKAAYFGDGGPATQAGVVSPDGAAMDGAGNLLIASDRWIRMVTG